MRRYLGCTVLQSFRHRVALFLTPCCKDTKKVLPDKIHDVEFVFLDVKQKYHVVRFIPHDVEQTLPHSVLPVIFVV